MNRRHLPCEIKAPGKLVRGQHIRMQDSTTPNPCATVWHDKKDVRVVSTMFDPWSIETAIRRVHGEGTDVNMLLNVKMYNKYMNGVDRHDQL